MNRSIRWNRPHRGPHVSRRSLTLVGAVAVAAGVVSISTASPLAGQAWTEAERAELLELLDASAADFAESVDGLSAAQWGFHESADRWSIGQVAEHLAITEDVVGGILRSLGTGTVAATSREDRAAMDERIREGLRDRSQRFQAPDVVAPPPEARSLSDVVSRFEKGRRAIIELVSHTDVDLRAYTSAHPAFGEIDGHQWVLLVTSHVWRHLEQVDEVKAHDGYPAR